MRYCEGFRTRQFLPFLLKKLAKTYQNDMFFGIKPDSLAKNLLILSSKYATLKLQKNYSVLPYLFVLLSNWVQKLFSLGFFILMFFSMNINSKNR